MPSGSGEEISSAVYEKIIDWALKDLVEAIVFDTTSSNTGVHNGACCVHIFRSKIGHKSVTLSMSSSYF